GSPRWLGVRRRDGKQIALPVVAHLEHHTAAPGMIPPRLATTAGSGQKRDHKQGFDHKTKHRTAEFCAQSLSRIFQCPERGWAWHRARPRRRRSRGLDAARLGLRAVMMARRSVW